MRSMSRVLPILGVLVASALLGGCSGDEPSDKERALEYARKACGGVNMDDSGDAAADDASAQAEAWRASADDAARAARLDPAWNELSRAIDVQYRGWRMVERGNYTEEEGDAAIAESDDHPYQPECRKALVD